MKHQFCIFLLTTLLSIHMAHAQDLEGDPILDSRYVTLDTLTGDLELTLEGASHFAGLAYNCLQTEYPNKLSHVMMDASQVSSPKSLHPAFYGCFDWHSSVHGHWMLVHLLRKFPEMAQAKAIRQKLNENLTQANLLQEAAYLHQKGRKSFERMYGWAWLLKLAEELVEWDDPDAQLWSQNLQPVTETVVNRYLGFLPRQTYPIRVGTHTNTAFGMSFAYDYARAVDHEELQLLLEDRAETYFLTDMDCPASYEPGGADFLSPCLEEANLMARVLTPKDFLLWIDHFLPDLSKSEPITLLEAAEVSDREDPQIVHLDGLNLSRAWCMRRIVSVLPADDSRRKILNQAAQAHIMATLPYIASGNYEGEHWLASFAVYALE